MKCDECNKKATKNFQLSWIVWKVDKNGDYSTTHELMDDQDPSGEDNRHYCNKHAEEFENGEL